MKKKKILGTILTLALVGGVMTACSASNATAPLEYSYQPPMVSASDAVVEPMAYAPAVIQPTTETQHAETQEQESPEPAEIITHVQMPASFVEELEEKSVEGQMAFWDEFFQAHPDVYTIEFYDEDGVVIWALVTSHNMAEVENFYFDDLDEALSLHRVNNLAMPTYLPEGFAFDRAWFGNFFCPITNPDFEYAGGQLFVAFTNGEETLTLEIRNHPEYGGFDTWTSCENLEEIIINGRNAIVGGGGLSVQVTSNARYTFFTGRNSTISYEELIKIAESIAINN